MDIPQILDGGRNVGRLRFVHPADCLEVAVGHWNHATILLGEPVFHGSKVFLEGSNFIIPLNDGLVKVPVVQLVSFSLI